MLQREGMWSWFLQRLTGLLLAVWLGVHMAVLHGRGNENQFFFAVTRRLQGGGWVFFDLLLIVLCLYHALNGVRAVLFDVVPTERGRRRIAQVLWVVGLIGLLFAYQVLTGFLTGDGVAE